MLPDTATELDLPDPDTDGAGGFLSDAPLSRKTIYRLAARGEITGYLLGGKRLWKRASLRAYKERCIAAGPQLLEPASLTGAKRPVGRPKKSES
jgi:excisionase family DNA binding protein